jgi:hypothetical protein
MYKDYYLDTNLLFSNLVPERQQSFITNMYERLMYDSFPNTNQNIDSIFHTLLKSGFLKNYKQETRDEKLEEFIKDEI